MKKKKKNRRSDNLAQKFKTLQKLQIHKIRYY